MNPDPQVSEGIIARDSFAIFFPAYRQAGVLSLLKRKYKKTKAERLRK